MGYALPCIEYEVYVYYSSTKWTKWPFRTATFLTADRLITGRLAMAIQFLGLRFTIDENPMYHLRLSHPCFAKQ